MGLFDKFTKALTRKDDGDAKFKDDPLTQQLATLNKEGRLHARYVLDADNVGSLRLDDGRTGTIKNISYGGFAVRFDLTPDDNRPIDKQVGATLTLLDRQIRCQVMPVRVVKQHASVFAAFSIVHEAADSLVFLREFIEPFRFGKSLMSIGENVRNEKFRGQQWTCLRGDGPTDVIIRRGEDSHMAEAMMTFKTQDSYGELTFRSGILKTGRVIKKSENFVQSMGAQIASTEELDPQLLRQAICILAASPSDVRLAVQPLLDEATKGLFKGKKALGGAA